MDLLATDATGAAVILGVIAPWIIAVVNRPAWSATVRAVVAVVISVLLGLGICAAAGTFDDGLVDVLGICATVLATSQAVYGRLFAGSQAALERLTSGRQPEPEPERHDFEDVDDSPGRHAEDRA